MNWKQIHWSDKLVGFGILLVVIQGTQSMAGVVLVPVALPVVVVLYLLSLAVVALSRSPRLIPLPPEPLTVTFLCTFFIAYGQLISARSYAQAETDLIFSATALMLIPGLARLQVAGAMEVFETCLAISLGTVGLLTGTLGAIKVMIDSAGGRASFAESSYIYPQGSSLVPDYNMTSLVVLMGVFAIVFLGSKMKSWALRLPMYFLAAVLSLIPLASSSRRYATALLFLTMGLALWLVFPVLIKPKSIGPIALIGRTAGALAIASPTILLSLVIFGAITEIPGLGPDSTINASIERFQTLSNFSNAIVESRGDHLERGLHYADRTHYASLLFGMGFDHMEQVSDGVELDYPHSPILSALLYGGLFSLLSVLAMLARPAYFLTREVKRHPYFFACYVPCLIFLLVSGNSFSTAFPLPFFAVLGYCLILAPDQSLSPQASLTAQTAG